jgi:hypothetical protein
MTAKALKPFLFLLVVMAMVSLACLGGTVTPAPEPVLVVTEAPPQQVEQPAQPVITEEPVQTEEPVPTEEPAAPEPLDFYTEEFDGDISNWTYFVTKNATNANEDSETAPYAEDGYLIFDLNDWLNVYAMYDPYTYDNVRIDVSVDNRGVNSNRINLLCRYSDEGWYEVSVANHGLYDFWVFDGAKQSYIKIADGGSTKIKPGKEINDYTLVCNDRNLTLYINGIETRTYTDNKYAFRRGQVGIGASAGVDWQTNNDLPVKVEFDYIQISQP